MAGLSLCKVIKRYGAAEVVHGVDIEIADGEFVVFVGPSGCGKSTLLRMIAGLEDISGGEIAIGGARVNDVEPADRGIAMVFQSYALYPHMTVEQNLSFGLRMNGNPRADTAHRVRQAAEVLQIDDLMGRRPKQLSGGQRQRVAIGRAIVRHPQVFLFDEPLSNLDAELRVQMRVEIARLHKQLGTTMVYVTHDQTEAMTLADKIVVLRNGHVEQIGAPLDLYDDPANRFVAGFVGSPRMNFLAGRIGAMRGQEITVELKRQAGAMLAMTLTEPPPPVGAEVVVGVRPEHFVDPAATYCRIEVDVEVTEHLGATSYVHIGTKSDEPLVIERDEARRRGADRRFSVGIAADKALLFAPDGRRLR